MAIVSSEAVDCQAERDHKNGKRSRGKKREEEKEMIPIPIKIITSPFINKVITFNAYQAAYHRMKATEAEAHRNPSRSKLRAKKSKPALL